MPHDKPKYLDDQPKERPGVYIIIAIAIVLAIALYGALQIYAGMVQGWDRRFNPDRDSAPPPGYNRRQAEADAALAEEKLPLLAAQRELEQAKTYDKCVNGTAFRKLPDGGWENIPNLRCNHN